MPAGAMLLACCLLHNIGAQFLSSHRQANTGAAWRTCSTSCQQVVNKLSPVLWGQHDWSDWVKDVDSTEFNYRSHKAKWVSSQKLLTH
jgi:predicted HD phosphohydrolase